MQTVTLNNGVEMPALGLGVFQTPPNETRDAARAALEAGYRHIDTAAAYGNERQVGEAVHSSDLDRSEVFLETKIWISDYGYDETLHGFEKSARKLGVDHSGSATSWSSTSRRFSIAPRWCRRSTRSRSTPTSSSARCRTSVPSAASSRRLGHRSAASPSTATVATAAPSTIPSSGTSPGPTARPQPK